MVSSTSSLSLIILQLSITENMNALCFANNSFPILQAFFKSIFILPHHLLAQVV